MATFSQADYSGNSYRSSRPDYDPALFAIIRDYHERGAGGGGENIMRLAADVACGTGQATVHLAELLGFERVVGVEPSQPMRTAAVQHPSITYVAGTDATAASAVEAALNLPPSAHALDLVTAAQCVHWFDMPAFFAQAHRLLKPGGRGTLAIWAYSIALIRGSPAASDALDDYVLRRLHGCWDERRTLLDAYYADPSFSPPAALFADPVRTMIPGPAHPNPVVFRKWTLPQLEAYLRTFSAYKTFKDRARAAAAAAAAAADANSEALGDSRLPQPPVPDPVDETMREVAAAVGLAPDADDALTRTLDIEWPVVLLMARTV
ncbi:S-adenosyl-L-methionine-dependent methyltransferase [Zopfochytrium polystomum]|nr:S-adenosyl-L-methionine-dependent methyltransferase [Zopfochytrium polystomum]